MFVKASVLALSLLKQLEGWRDKPYADGGGKMTIGWGHLIGPNEHYERITKEEGEKLFQQDVLEAEEVVNNSVSVPLTQGQFDALVLFVFNIGGDKFVTSGALRALNAGRYDNAISRMQKWDKVMGDDGVYHPLNGLVKRRAIEAKIWQGLYPKSV